MSIMFDSITNIISRRFGIDRSHLVPEASFEELGLDSLSQLELAKALHKELGVKIDDADLLDNMATIADMVRSLEKQGSVG